MSKLVKILLWAPGTVEVALAIGENKKEFIEALVEPRDETVTTGPGLAVGIPVSGFPIVSGLPFPGLVPVPLSPASTTKIAPEEAIKNAVARKLREYNLNIDKSRLKFMPLTTEEERIKYVMIVSYPLSESEKNILERRPSFSSLFPAIGFFPITNLPLGLPFVDAGIARFLTTRFDIIRDRVYLGDPRVIFPSNILPYNPLYPVPFYSPYFPGQIVRHESTYRRPEDIFGERSRSPSRSIRSPRSPRSSRSPRASSRSPSRRKETKSRDKYLKYKQKYLELKAKIDKL
jgi:hypothetical protein